MTYKDYREFYLTNGYLPEGVTWSRLPEYVMGLVKGESFISNVQLQGKNLVFSGIGDAFKGTLDLSSLVGEGEFPGFNTLEEDYGVILGTVATSNSYNDLDDKPNLESYMLKSENLSGLSNYATARQNLGLVIGTDVLAPNGSASNLTNFPTLNQNTTGSAASLTTSRTIWGQSFNGTANITGDLGTTGSRVPKGWFTDLEATNAPTIGGVSATGTGGLVRAISPTLTGTPVLPSTITMGANSFIRSGAHNLTFTTTAATNVILPTSGTLMTTSGNTTGSAATLTTARNLSIGGTAKSFNGSANVTWSTSEIGITKTNIDALSINAASVGGITVTGTPTSGQVLKATSGTAATWDDESVGDGGSVNTSFRTVTSTSGVFAESYDADQPNFQLTLDEDVEIEITDAVNGDCLIAEIVNPEDEPFIVTFIGSDKEYLIEGGEIAVFSMVTNANDETIWIKSILEDTASLYKEINATGAVAIDFKNYDFIKLNVEDENYLEFINPRKNVANLTLHLENREGVPYDIHFPENTLFKTLGQGATIELGSDKLGVFKFDYRDGGFICTSYDVEYDIPAVHTYSIVRRVNTGSTSDITATDGFIDWQNGFSGGPGGPFNNLQVTTGNNLAITDVTWTKHGSIPSSMPDTDFQTLFDSERWDESDGSEMKYTFSSMSAGTYKVRIYMGESNGLATVGTRVFDIKIQGSTVESNVDMVAKFGGNQIAGMVEYDNIIVSGTTLEVEWIHVTENPVVNGIEILKRD